MNTNTCVMRCFIRPISSRGMQALGGRLILRMKCSLLFRAIIVSIGNATDRPVFFISFSTGIIRDAFYFLLTQKAVNKLPKPIDLYGFLCFRLQN